MWDGDWAILEEYTTGNVLVEKYVQGYHGLVKTLVANIYYYQDELGSTSHVASASGALLEYYKYDLYGKPTYWSASGSQLTASSVKDLFTGQRWIVELGLYDDRNRFMSPDLGRFLQPDPIGFKGDASNLYRYCGNDWANRSDPMGLFYVSSDPLFQIKLRDQFKDSMEITKFQQLAQQVSTAQSVSVTGLNQGPKTDYEGARWALASDPLKNNMHLEKVAKDTDGNWLLRPATMGKDGKLTPLKAEEIGARENVQPKGEPTGNIRTVTSQSTNRTWIRGSSRDNNALIKDYVTGGVVVGSGRQKADGTVKMSQTYDIYFRASGAFEGFKYHVISTFEQVHHFQNGVNTSNDLNPMTR